MELKGQNFAAAAGRNFLVLASGKPRRRRRRGIPSLHICRQKCRGQEEEKGGELFLDLYLFALDNFTKSLQTGCSLNIVFF